MVLIKQASLAHKLIGFGSRTCGLARESDDFKYGLILVFSCLKNVQSNPCTSKEETQPIVIIED